MLQSLVTSPVTATSSTLDSISKNPAELTPARSPQSEHLPPFT